METLKDIFVPYDIAVQLKEIGFDEPCIAYFNSTSIMPDYPYMYVKDYGKNSTEDKNFTTAPTYEQVKKWFREKGLFGSVEHTYNVKEYSFHWLIVNDNKLVFYKDDIHQAQEIFDLTETFKTHEQAREALIYKLIEIYKNGK